MLGDIFSDIADAFTGTVSAAAKDPLGFLQNVASGAASVNIDDLVTAVQKLPGGDTISPELRKFVDGPMRDFAKSDVGKFLLEAAATSEYATLVPFLGPQWASVAFSEPAFFAGDDFSKAWANETINRIQQTAKQLSAGELDDAGLDVDTSWAQIPPEIQGDLNDLSDTLTTQIAKAQDYLHGLGLDELSALAYDELAKQLQIREDAAVAALVAVRNNAQELAEYQLMRFDPATGALIIPGATSTFQNQTTARAVQAEVARMTSTSIQPNLYALAHPSTGTTNVQAGSRMLVGSGASSSEGASSATAPVHPSLNPLPPHQQVVASAPLHTGLSTGAKLGIGAAALALLGVGAKVAGIL
jgi:hypothetical protein